MLQVTNPGGSFALPQTQASQALNHTAVKQYLENKTFVKRIKGKGIEDSPQKAFKGKGKRILHKIQLKERARDSPTKKAMKCKGKKFFHLSPP